MSATTSSPNGSADRIVPALPTGLGRLGLAIIVPSALIDVSLLRAWNNVNNGFHDSDWLVYYHAAERSLHGSDPYRVGSEFFNPPPFLLAARFALLFGYMPSRILWCIASLLMLLAAGRLMCGALQLRLNATIVLQGTALIALSTPTILLIPTSGNSTAPVVLGYALAIWCFCRGLDAAGGCALCVAVLVKPQLAFLTLPLLLYKRRWKASAAFVGLGCAAMLGSVIVLGTDTVHGFFRTLGSTESGAGSVSIWVRDIPGLHAMFLQAWPGSAAAGGVAYLLSGLLIVALARYWQGDWLPSSPQFACGWAALILVDLLAVPYAHTDDLVLLLVPIAVLCSFVSRPTGRDELDRWVLPAIVALYVAPTLVVYIRLHFPAIAMLSVLVLLLKLAPPFHATGQSGNER